MKVECEDAAPTSLWKRWRSRAAERPAIPVAAVLALCAAASPTLASADYRLVHVIWFLGCLTTAALVVGRRRDSQSARLLRIAAATLLAGIALGHAMTLSGDWYYYRLVVASRTGDVTALQDLYAKHLARKQDAPFALRVGDDLFFVPEGLWSSRSTAAHMRIATAALREGRFPLAEQEFETALDAARASGSSAAVIKAIEQGLDVARSKK